MAKMYYSNNPFEKKEHVRRREIEYQIRAKALVISASLNVILTIYLILRG